MNIDIRDLLVLSAIPGVGSTRLRGLVQHFNGTREIFHATGRELLAVENIERKTASTILEFFRSNQTDLAKRHADLQLSKLNKVKGRIVTYWDTVYPSNLKKIYDPPSFLFVRGTMSDQDEASVAIVGTRSPTRYGEELAERFAGELARIGIPVISGLARGIDTLAHQSALTSRGRTVAVIGSGVDLIYPPENAGLAQRIIMHGAVVSEFEMGAKPDAVNFPRRNRIISGMSLGTLVIETSVEGGAMITAATALDQNREVFAVPGPLNGKQRSGTHLLIKEGRAKLTESVDDILSELAPHIQKHITSLRPRLQPSTHAPDLTLFEQQVHNALGNEPTHIDALAICAGMPTPDALVQLLSLELKGIVRQLPGKFFVKV